jgi:hypothetical protein
MINTVRISAANEAGENDRSLAGEGTRVLFWSLKIRRGFVLFLVTVISMVCIPLAWVKIVSEKRGSSYNCIRAGMLETDAIHILGSDADYVCQVGDLRVVYFFSHRFLSGERVFREHPERFPTSVSAKEQIPDVYDAIQLLVGPERRIRAITWNGETLHIRTVSGEVPGSNVSELPEEFFQGNP